MICKDRWFYCYWVHLMFYVCRDQPKVHAGWQDLSLLHRHLRPPGVLYISMKSIIVPTILKSLFGLVLGCLCRFFHPPLYLKSPPHNILVHGNLDIRWLTLLLKMKTYYSIVMFVVGNIYKLKITNCDGSVSAWRIIHLPSLSLRWQITWPLKYYPLKLELDEKWVGCVPFATTKPTPRNSENAFTLVRYILSKCRDLSAARLFTFIYFGYEVEQLTFLLIFISLLKYQDI